jgi:SAM-dependent methyltransferase
MAGRSQSRFKMLVSGKFLKSMALRTFSLGYEYTFISRLSRMIFFGNRHKCPLCGSDLKTFVPFGLDFPVLNANKVVGGGYRLNSLCPVCGSLDRERLLYLFLLHKTDIFNNSPKNILHMAPERILSGILAKNTALNYLTADLHSKHVMVKMDILNIQFPDRHFDAIICNHVLEHIIDDHKAMCELFRVLKPGGWAILQVPISLSLNSTHEDFSIITDEGRQDAFGQDDHVRIYGADYKSRLENAGFFVAVFKWADEPAKFGGAENIYGLLEEESVYLATKRQ